MRRNIEYEVIEITEEHRYIVDEITINTQNTDGSIGTINLINASTNVTEELAIWIL